jgi:hypothetical protein
MRAAALVDGKARAWVPSMMVPVVAHQPHIFISPGGWIDVDHAFVRVGVAHFIIDCFEVLGALDDKIS